MFATYENIDDRIEIELCRQITAEIPFYGLRAWLKQQSIWLKYRCINGREETSTRKEFQIPTMSLIWGHALVW